MFVRVDTIRPPFLILQRNLTSSLAFVPNPDRQYMGFWAVYSRKGLRLRPLMSRDSIDQEGMPRQNIEEERVKPAGQFPAEKGKIRTVDKPVETKQKEEAESRDHVAPVHKRKTKLRQLDAKDVDAVFAEGQGAINSLRDVQVIVARLLGVTARVLFRASCDT